MTVPSPAMLLLQIKSPDCSQQESIKIDSPETNWQINSNCELCSSVCHCV